MADNNKKPNNPYDTENPKNKPPEKAPESGWENYNGSNYPGNRNNQNNGGNGNNSNQKPPGRNLAAALLITMAVIFGLTMILGRIFETNTNEISYDKFVNLVKAGQVERVEIASDRLNIYVNDKYVPEQPEKSQSSYALPLPTMVTQTNASRPLYTAYIKDDNLVQFLLDNNVEIKGKISNDFSIILSILLNIILPLVLIGAMMAFVYKRFSANGGPFSQGKSNAKVYVQKETGITFKDVAGEDEAKESLQEVVEFLHNPARYTKIGAKLPKGALLVGPPGTGKTLLAKAVAGEAHCPFFSLTGSDFVELYVGVGASRVRDLFKEANKNAPCIIFIDEIDGIGVSRGDGGAGGGEREQAQTLNQLLSEMDGFDSSKGIFLLAATNRPEVLDKALLRPGRFDRRVIVEKPDLKGRVNILKVHAKDVKMDETVNFDDIALATSGAVGADLANMINEAAINAVKEGRELVAQKDLFFAVEVVLVGKEKKDRIMSQKERKIVAYHEVGHALVSALEKNAEPVQKITIVPRTMGALGYVMHVPEEEKYLNTQAELVTMLTGLVAGRASEEIFFETVTTGAANDIEKATELARSMVTRYGMSKRFGMMALETVKSRYLDGRAVMTCSDVTAAAVDDEVKSMLENCYNDALRMINENKDCMDALAGYLIEHETITGKEFMKIFREVKGLPEPEEKKPTEDKAAHEAVQTA